MTSTVNHDFGSDKFGGVEIPRSKKTSDLSGGHALLNTLRYLGTKALDSSCSYAKKGDTSK